MCDLARLADAPELDGILVGVSVGDVGVGRIRNQRQGRLALRLRLRQLLLEALQLRLRLLQLLELLGSGLSLRLRQSAQLVHLRHQLEPAPVGLDQLVEGLDAALARERGAKTVGIGAGCLEVDHGRKSTGRRTASGWDRPRADAGSRAWPRSSARLPLRSRAGRRSRRGRAPWRRRLRPRRA